MHIKNVILFPSNTKVHYFSVESVVVELLASYPVLAGTMCQMCPMESTSGKGYP